MKCKSPWWLGDAVWCGLVLVLSGRVWHGEGHIFDLDVRVGVPAAGIRTQVAWVRLQLLH
jgi:hypothetical protein